MEAPLLDAREWANEGRRLEFDEAKELDVDKEGECLEVGEEACFLETVGTSSFKREMRRPNEFRPSMAAERWNYVVDGAMS